MCGTFLYVDVVTEIGKYEVPFNIVLNMMEMGNITTS